MKKIYILILLVLNGIKSYAMESSVVKQTDINDLPNEMLYGVLKQINIGTFYSFSLVDKRFNSIYKYLIDRRITNFKEYSEEALDKMWLQALEYNNYFDLWLLLKSGFKNINLMQKNGCTALMSLCSESDKLGILKLILAHEDLDINIQNEDWETALMIACRSSCDRDKNDVTKFIKLLLNRNDINVNLTNNNRRSALFVAVCYGLEEIANLIVKKHDFDFNSCNLDLNYYSTLGAHSVLLKACKVGNQDIVKKFIDNKYIYFNHIFEEPIFEEPNTPLIEAIEANQLEIVKLLLNIEDIDVNRNRVPLIRAVIGGRIEIVKLLLKRDDIDINVLNEKGKTALQLAQEAGHTEIANLLKSFKGYWIINLITGRNLK